MLRLHVRRVVVGLLALLAAAPVWAQPHTYVIGLTCDRAVVTEDHPTATLTLWCAINGSATNNFGPSNLLAGVTADIPGGLGTFSEAGTNGAVSPFNNGPTPKVVNSEGVNISISGIDAFRGLTSAYPAGDGPPAYGANQLVRGYSFRLTMTDFSPRTVTVSATAAGGVISSWLFVPSLSLWVPLAGSPLPETHASISFDVGGPPRIVLEPVGREVPQGDNAVLSAAATGSVPLAWQWRHNGANLVDTGRVSGARTPSLTIGSFQPSDTGQYDAVVTNAYASATTSAATLTMGPKVPLCQEWSAEFGGSDFSSGAVRTTLVYDDGSGPSLFVGGDFRTAGSVNSAHVAAWNGYSWRGLAGGVNIVGGSTGVFALAAHDVDGPGKAPTHLYAGGNFTRIGGQTCTGVARWNGASWTPVGAGLNGTVRALAVFDEDGAGPLQPMLFAAGTLSLSTSHPITNIARWDGAAWSQVAGGLTNGGASVQSLVVYDDGSGEALYAAGNFDTAGGNPARRVSKWDGASWAPVGAGIGGDSGDQVYALAVFNDGAGDRLYAAGHFAQAGGAAAANIARWTGTSWEAVGLGIPPGGGQNQAINCLRAFHDGTRSRLYAGGAFSPGSGASIRRLASWDGSAWTEVGAGLDNEVFTLQVFDRGSGPSLYAFGSFVRVGGTTQSPGMAEWTGVDWLPRANGVAGSVTALATHDDGTGPALFAGGTFPAAGSAFVRNLAKWNGGAWQPLGGVNAGPTGPVYTMTSADVGAETHMLYVGGEFGTVRTVESLLVGGIAAWDGTVWTDMDEGFRGERSNAAEVFDTLYIHDDAPGAPASGLYAAGNLELAGGSRSFHIATWDGQHWEAFNSSPEQLIYATAAFDAGNGPRLYAAGSFQVASGMPAARIAVWNGTSWTPLSSGMNGIVRTLAVFDDGTGEALYAGGMFTTAGGVTARGIARWNGSSWSPVRSGPDDPQQLCDISTLEVLDTGDGPALYAGGNIQRMDGVTMAMVARWDGAQWTSPATGMNCCVLALEVFDDGSGPTLYAGGTFLTAGPERVNRIAKLVGGQWLPVSEGFVGDVTALEVFDDGSGPALFAGGNFEWANADGTILRVARLTPDGWVPVGAGIPANTSSFGTFVYALKVFDDGSGPALYAGGNFNRAGSVLANRLARWNGTEWSDVHGGAVGANDAMIRSLCILEGGPRPRLCAAGLFSLVGATNVQRVARWNGSEWMPLGSGLEDGQRAHAMALFDEDADGPNPAALFVGGTFLTAGGVPASLIARWDGTTWTSVGPGLTRESNDTSGGVYAMVVHDDGSGPALFAGGQFTHADGAPASAIAKWDGAAWSPVGGGLLYSGGDRPRVSALAVYDDGTGPALYATGQFTQSGAGSPLSNLARWDGKAWTSVQGGLNGQGHALLADDPFGGASLHVGGAFTASGGVAASRLAKLGPCPPRAELPPCLFDWDVSGVINSQDFFTFLTDFFDLRADLNADGATNSQDFFDFLAGFFTGC